MTTVLIIVALMLVGSAVWGFWGAGLGRGVSRTKSKAGASAPPFLADDPRSREDSFDREQRGGGVSKQAQERFDPEQHRLSLGPRRGELVGDVAARPSWREYIPLAIVLLFLLLFDTETWLQRTLLLILGFAVALLMTLSFILMGGRGKQSGVNRRYATTRHSANSLSAAA
jgi:uncharacterized membrane protein YecN with MAPEG domain